MVSAWASHGCPMSSGLSTATLRRGGYDHPHVSDEALTRWEANWPLPPGRMGRGHLGLVCVLQHSASFSEEEWKGHAVSEFYINF